MATHKREQLTADEQALAGVCGELVLELPITQSAVSQHPKELKTAGPFPNLTTNFLFVCIKNANRSQMAQAFTTIHGGAQVAAYSAGARPSGVVNPKAVAAMAGLGYGLSQHASESSRRDGATAPAVRFGLSGINHLTRFACALPLSPY